MACSSPPPGLLTCYRRNLFQVSGELTFPSCPRYVVTEKGEEIEIVGQELVVDATESIEGNSVKIIALPWKTPANSSQLNNEHRVECGPSAIPLHFTHDHKDEPDTIRFPFHWKRLQFRGATANNGRHKQLQQHFVMRLKVIVSLSTGEKVPIYEGHSGGIIVRGRSPRNFQTRKDRPIDEYGKRAFGARSRTLTGQSKKSQNDTNKNNRISTTTPGFGNGVPEQPVPLDLHYLMDLDDANLNNRFFDWCDLENPDEGAPSALQLTTSPFEAFNTNNSDIPQSRSNDQHHHHFPAEIRSSHHPPQPNNAANPPEPEQLLNPPPEPLDLDEDLPSNPQATQEPPQDQPQAQMQPRSNIEIQKKHTHDLLPSRPHGQSC